MSGEAKRAEILLEALPYIRKFYGKTIVIKFGGAAMNEPNLSREFARDVTLLQYVGMRPVIVHGGGKQIGQTMDRLGLSSEFIDGYRVTDDQAMDVVEMVLSGKINKEIVALINHEGGRAVGISGRDGSLARADIHEIKRKSEGGGLETINLGRVGTLGPHHIDPSIINTLDKAGFIPVIAPIATGPNGSSLNINADIMAGAIARALAAEKLILLTNTRGILKNSETIAKITVSEATELLKENFITGGMLPKIQCCLDALKEGVKTTHIIDGTTPHALLLEIFTTHGIGTLISAE